MRYLFKLRKKHKKADIDAHISRFLLMLISSLLLVFVSTTALALTRMAYDIEPNDALHQAIDLSMPVGKDVIRVIGELDGQDQDAFRIIVDEDMSGRRLSLELTGRGGALTQLDILDLTDLADSRGRIPEQLTNKPPLLATLRSKDGSRPARLDALLLAPGVYVFGVSHSGGQGAYSLELSMHDDARLVVLDTEQPHALSLRGRTSTWSAGNQIYAFALSAEQAEQAWDLEFQTPLAKLATVALLDPAGDELFKLSSENGLPLRRSGMKLSAGDYRIVVESSIPGARLFQLQPGAENPLEGMEIEPNDRTPTPIGFGQALNGRLDDTDRDDLIFSLNEEQAQQLFDLEVTASPDSEIEFCLTDPSNNLNYCRRAKDGKSSLLSLGLGAGQYRLSIYDRRQVGTDWSLIWNLRDEIEAGEEVEPNDDYRQAAALHDRGFGRGEFVGNEWDHWRFSVIGQPQLWRIQLQGDNLHELRLSNADNQQIAVQRAGNNSRVRLDNQFLMPGDYLITAQGADSQYTVRLQPLGPPPPGMELEPNNDVANARTMQFGQAYTGTLAESGDVDRYRISLLGEDRFRIKVQPPPDGSMQGEIGVGDESSMVSDIRNGHLLGAPLEWDLSLPAGDYVLSLFAATVSDAEYSIEFERLDWLEAPIDREPNHIPDLASSLPLDGLIEGSVGATHAKLDLYRLPEVKQPMVLELPMVTGLTFFLLIKETETKQKFEQDRAQMLQSATLSPGQDYILWVTGNGEYSLDLSVLLDQSQTNANTDQPSVAIDDQVQIQIDIKDSTIQAFSPWLQTVEGALIINSSPQMDGRELMVKAHLTHSSWLLQGLPETIRLSANAEQRIPFAVEVAPDAPISPSVQLSIQLTDPNFAKLTVGAALQISAGLDDAAVQPEFYWAVPEALRGGLNAAALRFGAEPVASPGLEAKYVESMVRLFDGLATYGRWTGYTSPTARTGTADFGQPTVQLAGETPVPVRGFLINPTSGMSVNDLLKDFEIAVSLDGEHFDTILAERLKPVHAEQAFILDQAVSARYVRLIPLSANLADAAWRNGIRLGEFKVIADAGWRPQAEPFNLADPSLGGHLVWAEPWFGANAMDTRLLIEDQKSSTPSIGVAVDRVDLVIGFEHARSARIGSVRMIALEDAGNRVRPAHVGVYASNSSPIGPWQEVGVMNWQTDQIDLKLDQPIWARYLRFQFELDEESRAIELPDQISVFEADGPSVIGEWGHLAGSGPYELENTPIYSGLTGQPDHNSKINAKRLSAGEPAPGRALLDQYSSWYRMTVPATNNQLELKLSGRPTLEGAPRLIDAGDNQIELYKVETDGYSAVWQAWVEPGADYWLEVYEPPRSVIFSWDTSGSVASWLPTISSALLSYAGSVVPGRDEVNLLPFGYQRPLLENWVGQPYPLTRMMASYPRETSSSDAEGTLAVAARAMVGRPGKKAVLLLTDAATGTAQTLWPSLLEGQPQVFSMKLSSEGALGPNPEPEIDLMQDWAQVRGGHFQYVTGFGSLAHGFDRAVAWLKRPVDFSVEASFARVDDPAPATLSVIAGEAGIEPAARGAVAIILDASGSMLKKMDGSRRIDIAKAAIRRTVEESLPEGLPLALRVYGHREAGSCRSDLEVPLAPLNKIEFLSTLEQIQAINLARTPIADSIAAVKNDLSSAQGRKLVVLLTDGEETCEGDPAAAIKALQAAGVDVRINIVGFAIDDQALKAQFAEWASLGGGNYLDATDAEGLNSALEQSLRTPFVVRDGSGEVVAEGTVDGESIELPPGRYQLEFELDGASRAQDLILAPGEERVFELDQS